MRKTFLPAVTALALIVAAAAGGCSGNTKTPDITAATVTPTQGGDIFQASPAVQDNDPAGMTDNEKNDNNAVPKPAPTDPGKDVTSTPDPKQENASPTPTLGADKNDVTGEPDNDPEPTGDADPDDGDRAVITEHWNESFLIWLPPIGSGSFKRFESDETHDYITLEDISVKNVKEYIEKLTGAGFIEDAGYSDVNGAPSEFSENIPFRYSAYNEDGWNVQLDYDPGKSLLTIGSGYDPDTDDDEYARLREETLIGKLPEFIWGDFDSSKQEGSMIYCIFSNVDPECSEYVESLKAAGFTEEADEGSEDGIIWYIASDGEGLMCDFIYTEGAARCGCGRE